MSCSQSSFEKTKKNVFKKMLQKSYFLGIFFEKFCFAETVIRTDFE